MGSQGPLDIVELGGGRLEGAWPCYALPPSLPTFSAGRSNTLWVCVGLASFAQPGVAARIPRVHDVLTVVK